MFRRLNYAEPAVLRGIFGALFALLIAVGVQVPASWESFADELSVAVGVVAPLVVGLWTRRAVYSPQSVDHVTTAQDAA